MQENGFKVSIVSDQLKDFKSTKVKGKTSFDQESTQTVFTHKRLDNHAEDVVRGLLTDENDKLSAVHGNGRC